MNRTVDSRIPKPISQVRERKSISLTRQTTRSSQKEPPTRPAERARSATHCSRTADPHPQQQRPWSSSVLVDKNSASNQKPSVVHKPGYLPEYLRKRKSPSIVSKPPRLYDEELLENETPPPLVPSEIGEALLRQTTFELSEDIKASGGDFQVTEKKLLEDALEDLTEQKTVLTAQNEWLQRESASQQEIIANQRKKVDELERFINLEVQNETTRLCVEVEVRDQQIASLRKHSEETIDALQRGNLELRQKVEHLLVELTALRQENELLRDTAAHSVNFTEGEDNEECIEKSNDDHSDSSDDKKATIEFLERNLKKYRAARKVLKERVQKLTTENEDLRRSIFETSSIEGLVKQIESKNSVANPAGSSDEEVINRVDCVKELREQKRTRQTDIQVRKYKF